MDETANHKPPVPVAATPAEGMSTTAICRKCGLDMTDRCLAFILRGPVDDQLVILRPRRCPSCEAPVYQATRGPRVLRPQ
mgnify:FL=1